MGEVGGEVGVAAAPDADDGIPNDVIEFKTGADATRDRRSALFENAGAAGGGSGRDENTSTTTLMLSPEPSACARVARALAA